MFDKNFNDINYEDLKEFFERKSPESKTLEYKELLKISQEEDRKEFLSDVSSFANGAGGYILFGVKAVNGIPVDMVGVDIKNLDSEKIRIDNIINDSIKPRVEVNIKDIQLPNNNYVIIVSIKESLNPPHGVVSGKHYKFFIRKTASKSELDIDQLRDVFLRSSSLIEKIREFRLDRVAKIYSDKTPVDVNGDSRMIIHILPKQSFSGEVKISKKQVEDILKEEPASSPCFSSRQGWNSPRVNLDGYIDYLYINDSAGKTNQYCQLFRNGIIEGVDSYLLEKRIFKSTGEDYIPSQLFEEYIYFFIKNSLDFIKKLGIVSEFYVFITLTNIKGKTLSTSNRFSFDFEDKLSFRENNIFLPEIVVDSLNKNIDSQIKESIDLIWNAIGIDESVYKHN